MASRVVKTLFPVSAASFIGGLGFLAYSIGAYYEREDQGRRVHTEIRHTSQESIIHALQARNMELEKRISSFEYIASEVPNSPGSYFAKQWVLDGLDPTEKDIIRALNLPLSFHRRDARNVVDTDEYSLRKFTYATLDGGMHERNILLSGDAKDHDTLLAIVSAGMPHLTDYFPGVCDDARLMGIHIGEYSFGDPTIIGLTRGECNFVALSSYATMPELTYHEIGHSATGHLPRWLAEGVVEYVAHRVNDRLIADGRMGLTWDCTGTMMRLQEFDREKAIHYSGPDIYRQMMAGMWLMHDYEAIVGEENFKDFTRSIKKLKDLQLPLTNETALEQMLIFTPDEKKQEVSALYRAFSLSAEP